MQMLRLVGGNMAAATAAPPEAAAWRRACVAAFSRACGAPSR